MPWTEDTLQEAEEELWEIARDYFRLQGKTAAQRAQLVTWERDFRRILHRLALDAREAHVVHYSPTVMGIDHELLKGEKQT